MVGHRKEVGIEFQGEGVFAWTRRERGGKRHDPCKHGRLAAPTTNLNTAAQHNTTEPIFSITRRSRSDESESLTALWGYP